ncbi:hypothetical protein [Xanthomonas sp. WHRI 1810A]|jgi:hypothetical protein|uniref:hypothetical protein n=1 Tax=Xanthomonas sp. WHRI 1810A TaxID=3161565 RepID=UPI0032E92FE9
MGVNPVYSEHQLEQGDNHDQADDENDSDGATKKLQHWFSPLIFSVSSLGPQRTLRVSSFCTVRRHC